MQLLWMESSYNVGEISRGQRYFGRTLSRGAAGLGMERTPDVFAALSREPWLSALKKPGDGWWSYEKGTSCLQTQAGLTKSFEPSLKSLITGLSVQKMILWLYNPDIFSKRGLVAAERLNKKE